MEDGQSHSAPSKKDPTITIVDSTSTLGGEQGFINIEDEQGDSPSEKEELPSYGVSKIKKQTSDVWLHFDVVWLNGIKKAKCKHCKKLLSHNDKGVSHLRKHAFITCHSRTIAIDSSQTKLKIISEVDGTTTLALKEKNKEFDQIFSRKKLVIAIVLHEYPLSMVEHVGFRDFIQSLNTPFKMISRNTLKSDILKMFKEEKVYLQRLLEHNDSRVAVTTDMWTASNQKKGYMVVTSHFIDQKWVLRNRTLRFVFVPCPHTKGVIAKVLMDCLSQYSLEGKISTVVVDNCTTNDAMVKILLKNFDKKCLMLEGNFLHLRCSAHILNLVVKDGLDVIGSGIIKVRDCVSFWMSTPKRIEKFEKCCSYLGINNQKGLVLDCKTRWNSTYYMLLAALPYMDVFDKLKLLNKRMKFEVPSKDDWMLAKLVCDKLEIFEIATKVFSGRHDPTSHVFFQIACQIKLKLLEWLKDDSNIIKSMATNMIGKFDKYWEHINGILAIAVILDPRHKTVCIEHYFEKLYGDRSETETMKVTFVMEQLVLEYQRRSEGSKDEEHVLKGSEKKLSSNSCFISEDDEYAQKRKAKRRRVNVKGELDHYLEDEIEEDHKDFDILKWWKTDRRYPILRKIAKDILAIPISSVASESAFSMGGRVVSPHRARLHANTVESLMCLQNWKMQEYQGGFEGTNAYSSVNEDSDVGGEVIDIIDMDVDDIPNDEMEDDLLEFSSLN